MEQVKPRCQRINCQVYRTADAGALLSVGAVKTKGAAQWKTVAEGATAVSHGSDDPVWDEEDPDVCTQ